MNKKLPRLLQPGMRLYFILLVLFAVATFFFHGYHIQLTSGMLVAAVLLAVYWRIAMKRRTNKLLAHLESMTEGLDRAIADSPFPVLIFSSKTHEILWTNDKFVAMTALKDPFFELDLSKVVPNYNFDWLLDGRGESPETVLIDKRAYKVFGNIISSDNDFIATTYWIDVTEFERICNDYFDSRQAIAVIVVDNFEEVTKGLTEKEKSILLSDVDEKINQWIEGSEGFLCRVGRDRYVLILEDKNLRHLAARNFELLKTVHSSIGANGMHASISIGVGKDGISPVENSRFANLGVDMALSRGGDQAVIKNRHGYEFFGGHSSRRNSSTKVRSRIMANTFGELIKNASMVYVMGHKFADNDCVAAAIGVCCIARAMNKDARIIINTEKAAATDLIEMILKTPVYNDIFISEQKAILEADMNSLLVVVDTTRPEKVESESLLLSCSNIAVIDHHRRAADYIDNAIFNYHEPYASSTSELITEMLQFLVEIDDIQIPEAEALLAGIALDTKGFAINTGSRTFEAAAFLKRIGADAVTAKKLMQSNIDIATSRYAIMGNARVYREGVAIASSSKAYNRIAIAQAADELLNIKGVSTSFVAAQDGENPNDVFVSARSIGGMNVQVVLEQLGGGGSQSTAGLQAQNTTVDKVITDIEQAIDEVALKAGKA